MLSPKKSTSEGHHSKNQQNNKKPIILQRKGENSFQFNEAGKIIGQNFQTKLQVGETGDSYEREADRVADKVVAKSESPSKGGDSAPVKTSKVGSGSLAQRMEKPVEEEVQLKSNDASSASSSKSSGGPNIAAQLASSKGSGDSMEKSTKTEMESGFGRDFDDVKIHTDSKASEMSDALNAKAFTSGKDIYFNKGQYSPESKDGKHLLAHELTHTVQQDGKIRRQIMNQDPPMITDPIHWNTNPFDELVPSPGNGTQVKGMTNEPPAWMWTTQDQTYDEQLLEKHSSQIAETTRKIIENIIRTTAPNSSNNSYTPEELLTWRQDVIRMYNEIAGLKDDQVFDFRSGFTLGKQRERLNIGLARLEYQDAKKGTKAGTKDEIAEIKQAFELEIKEAVVKIEDDEGIVDKKAAIKSTVSSIRKMQRDKLKTEKERLKKGEETTLAGLKTTKKTKISQAKSNIKALKESPDREMISSTDRAPYDQELEDLKLIQEANLLFKLIHFHISSKNLELNNRKRVIDPKEFKLGDKHMFALEPIQNLSDVLPLITPRARESVAEKGGGPFKKFQSIEKKITEKQAELKALEKYIGQNEKVLEKDEEKKKLTTETKDSVKDHVKGKEKKEEKLKKEIESLTKSYNNLIKEFSKPEEKGTKTLDERKKQEDKKKAIDDFKKKMDAKEKEDLEKQYVKLYNLKPEDNESDRRYLDMLVKHSIDKIQRQKWQEIVWSDEPGAHAIGKAGKAKEGTESTEVNGDQLLISNIVQEGVYGVTPEKRYEDFHKYKYIDKPKGQVKEKLNWLINYSVKVKE